MLATKRPQPKGFNHLTWINILQAFKTYLLTIKSQETIAYLMTFSNSESSQYQTP